MTPFIDCLPSICALFSSQAIFKHLFRNLTEFQRVKTSHQVAVAHQCRVENDAVQGHRPTANGTELSPLRVHKLL